MKEALISPTEKVYKYDGTLLGDRVAEVTTNPFVVAPPLFWVACPDDCVADQFYYDPVAEQFGPIPVPPPPMPPSEVTGDNGPTVA